MSNEPTYRFTETTTEHAARLGRNVRWTKIRRRALLLKLDGLAPEQVRQRMGASNCPCNLAQADVETLLELLAVQESHASGEPLLDPNLKAIPPGPTLLEMGGEIFGGHHGRQGDKEALARAGVMLGHPPYGYRKAGTQVVTVADAPKRVARIDVEPSEVPHVRFLFDKYLADWTFSEIAQELNSRKIPTRSGRPWSPDTLRDMLRNPVYAGYILYRGAKDRNRRDAGILYPGLHPPIISWNTFCKAQDTRVQRAARNPKPFWQCPWQGAPGRKQTGKKSKPSP